MEKQVFVTINGALYRFVHAKWHEYVTALLRNEAFSVDSYGCRIGTAARDITAWSTGDWEAELVRLARS